MQIKTKSRKATVSLSTALLLASLTLATRPLPAQVVGTAGSATGFQATFPPPPAAPQPNSATADTATPAASDTYIIGNTDLLSVFVYQMPELTREIRVDSTGKFRLPFLRTSLHASGETAPQLQREIAAELASEGLARYPEVHVVVVQVESKPIVVIGAVKNPITIQAARPLRLLEVLSRAGGLDDLASDEAIVSGGGAAKFYDLDKLLSLNPKQENPLLTGGETVTVLPARNVYVVGAFQKPGSFPLRVGQPIGVIQAVALAQGFKASPDKGGAEIIHTLGDGTHAEQHVDINKILQHKMPNPALEAGDILYVPEDEKRAVLISALQDAAQLVTFGVAYHFP